MKPINLSQNELHEPVKVKKINVKTYATAYAKGKANFLAGRQHCPYRSHLFVCAFLSGYLGEDLETFLSYTRNKTPEHVTIIFRDLLEQKVKGGELNGEPSVAPIEKIKFWQENRNQLKNLCIDNISKNGYAQVYADKDYKPFGLEFVERRFNKKNYADNTNPHWGPSENKFIYYRILWSDDNTVYEMMEFV